MSDVKEASRADAVLEMSSSGEPAMCMHVRVCACVRVQVVCARVCVVPMESSEHRSSRAGRTAGPVCVGREHRTPTPPSLSFLCSCWSPPLAERAQPRAQGRLADSSVEMSLPGVDSQLAPCQD